MVMVAWQMLTNAISLSWGYCLKMDKDWTCHIVSTLFGSIGYWTVFSLVLQARATCERWALRASGTGVCWADLSLTARIKLYYMFVTYSIVHKEKRSCLHVPSCGDGHLPDPVSFPAFTAGNHIFVEAQTHIMQGALRQLSGQIYIHNDPPRQTKQVRHDVACCGRDRATTIASASYCHCGDPRGKTHQVNLTIPLIPQ